MNFYVSLNCTRTWYRFVFISRSLVEVHFGSFEYLSDVHNLVTFIDFYLSKEFSENLCTETWISRMIITHVLTHCDNGQISSALNCQYIRQHKQMGIHSTLDWLLYNLPYDIQSARTKTVHHILLPYTYFTRTSTLSVDD